MRNHGTRAQFEVDMAYWLAGEGLVADRTIGLTEHRDDLYKPQTFASLCVSRLTSEDAQRDLVASMGWQPGITVRLTP